MALLFRSFNARTSLFHHLSATVLFLSLPSFHPLSRSLIFFLPLTLYDDVVGADFTPALYFRVPLTSRRASFNDISFFLSVKLAAGNSAIHGFATWDYLNTAHVSPPTSVSRGRFIDKRLCEASIVLRYLQFRLKDSQPVYVSEIIIR